MSVFKLTNPKVQNVFVISHSSKGLKGVKATIKNMLRQYEMFIKSKGTNDVFYKELDFFKIFTKETVIDDIIISPYIKEEQQTPLIELSNHENKKNPFINYDGLKKQRDTYELNISNMKNEISQLEKQIKTIVENMGTIDRKVFYLNELIKFESLFNE